MDTKVKFMDKSSKNVLEHIQKFRLWSEWIEL